MKAQTLIFASLFLSLPSTGAQAETSLQQRYGFDPYGHLHGAYQSFDDGQSTTETLVDPSTSIGRIGFYLKPTDLDDGLSFQFETSLGFRPSSNTSQIETPRAWDWSRRNLRQVQLIHKSSWGTFRLGQGSMPLDSAAEVDLGGYNAVAKSNITEGYGAYILRRADGALSDITIKDGFDSFDGDRRFRLRWDSPEQAGWSLSLAYGTEVLKSGDDNLYYDTALRFAGQIGDTKLKAAFGSAWENSDTTTSRVTVGSVGFLHEPSGLNGTLAAGQSAEDTRPSYVYLRGGWNRQFLAAGETKLAVEYFKGFDYQTQGARSEMWGIALFQKYDGLNLLAYLGYRQYSYKDATPALYQAADGLQIGIKWSF